MQTPLSIPRRLLLAGAVGALAIGGATAGVAASSGGSATPQQAVIADAAARLKVTPAALSSALSTAYRHELATLVAGKRITQKQADRLARRAAGGKVPLAPVTGRGVRSKGALRTAAAGYLGIEPKALRTELRSGKSLAQIATARDKTVAGLKAALTAAVETRLHARVAAGSLTAERAAARLARIGARLDRMIARVHHARAGAAT